VFPYSAREGTPAAQFPLQVPEPVKAARTKQMQAVANASAQTFARSFIGRRMPVLWESCDIAVTGERVAALDNRRGQNNEDERAHADGMVRFPLWSGYTDNYVRVTAPNEGNWRNRIATAELIEPEGDGIRGRLIEEIAKVSGV
jgi:tRNA A37 methylthiotransferase MiaB